MLRKIDYNRFNFCLQIGRQFYIACKLVNEFSKLMNVNYIDIDLCDFYNSSLMPVTLSSERRTSFNSLDSSYVNSSDNSETSEFFSLFKRKAYINIYKNVNHDEFNNYFRNLFSPGVIDIMYVSTSSIVPVEFNNYEINISCEKGEKELEYCRHPFIEVLYRSNEMVEFTQKFIGAIMTSTHLWEEILIYGAKYESHGNFRISSISAYYNSWEPDKMMNLGKAFKRFEDAQKYPLF